MDLVAIKQSPSKGAPTLAEKHTKELEKFIKLEVRALAALLAPLGVHACGRRDDARPCMRVRDTGIVARGW
jgi:hypothetical protein